MGRGREVGGSDGREGEEATDEFRSKYLVVFSLEVLLCSTTLTTRLCISIHFRFLSIMFTRSFPAVNGL